MNIHNMFMVNEKIIPELSSNLLNNSCGVVDSSVMVAITATVT